MHYGLVILGILGASNLIIARQPKAKELIGKIAPYQGWIGASSALWGIYLVVINVLGISSLLKAPVSGALTLGGSVVMAALGLLLGIGVLKTFIKQPQAVEKMDALATRLAPKQGLLGLVAIGVGIAQFVIR